MGGEREKLRERERREKLKEPGGRSWKGRTSGSRRSNPMAMS